MSDKSVQKEYEYSDILKTVIDVVSERSEDKIVSENSVLRNILEHKYDDTESLEILMDVENIYKLPVGEKPELEQKLLNAKTGKKIKHVNTVFIALMLMVKKN